MLRLLRVQVWIMVGTFALAGAVLVRAQVTDSIEHRVTVVETKLDSLQSIAQALLIMVGGSLLLQGLNLRQRRANAEAV